MSEESNDMIRILLGEKYQQALTEWEVEFLESIAEREALTVKQYDKLESIWHEIVERGR